jgi:hypothetical protein
LKKGRELVGRLVAEFAIIVLGVLVALGVDDWRARQAEISREAYLLESFREDLDADLADFQAARANAQKRASASFYILSELNARMPRANDVPGIGGGPGTPFAPDSLAPIPGSLTEALQSVASVANFDFTTGTLEEVLSTGAFEVIRADSLRRGISRYYALASDRLEADTRIREALFRYQEALLEVGLAPGDDGEVLRTMPPSELEKLTAAIRLAWGFAAVQSMLAEELSNAAGGLLDLILGTGMAPPRPLG